MAPEARSISPSQHWDGNDGPWSSFAIVVGDPPDTLLVLPSTSGRSTWVVLPLGCEARDDPDNCDSQRGGIFNPANSTTFKQIGDTYYQLNFGPELPLSPALPPDLNYSGASLPGTDKLAFGFNSDDAPTLENQLIVGFPAKVPFLGTLGLSAFNETVVNYQDVHLSVLGALRNISAISSRYWGYTAGARYRDTFGSLTFGGYDASRGNVDDVLTVPMDQQDSNRSLTLELLGTTLSDNSGHKETNMAPIPIFIDSVVPEIWLPEDLCTQIENYFGLVWNETVGRYLVDDGLHSRLTEQNASVTFSLAATAQDSGNSVDITLPYGAWDLTVGYPYLQDLYPDNTSATLKYFPLKRATDPNQYYLGRTFLQEAYVAADYDRGEFYVSPATFSSTDQDIRTVHPPGGGGDSLSRGAIAGIAIGALTAVAIVAGLLWWFCLRKRKGKKKERRSTLGTSSIGDNTTIAEWNNDVPMHQVEQYKPSEMSGDEADQFKPELDATVTARGAPTERHELWAGHVRRPSDQSRASISPLEERVRNSRFGHNRTISSNSFGSPSPPMSDHPSPPLASSGRESPFGQPSPPIGARTPASADQDRSWFGGVPVFELHGRSRDSPRSPTSPFRAPEEMPSSSENVQGQGERETRRSGFVEEFDRPAQS